MTVVIEYTALFLFLWLGNYAIYRLFNHGVAQNAKLQQLLRYLVATIVASVPLVISKTSVVQPTVLLSLTVAELWAFSYPVTYHLTHRHSAPDYDHQIDPAFGIYLFGLITGLTILLWPIPSVLLPVAAVLPVLLWGYWFTCHHVLDVSGMKMLQETHYNEIIEFVRSYSVLRVLSVVLSSSVIAPVGKRRGIFSEGTSV